MPGAYGTRVPYGWRAIEGELVKHEGEQEVIRQAKALKAAGLSLRAVGVELERAGFLGASKE